MMKNGWLIPNSIQISMNLTYDVGGSLDETDWLSVYITNMEVMATGILVLKCSSLKYTVIYQTKNE